MGGSAGVGAELRSGGHMTALKYETCRTWRRLDPVSLDGPTPYNCDPQAPDGDGWEPFAAGVQMIDGQTFIWTAWRRMTVAQIPRRGITVR